MRSLQILAFYLPGNGRIFMIFSQRHPMLQFSEFFAFSQGVLSKVEAVLSWRGTGGGEVQGDILALMNIEYSLKRKSSSSNEVISQTCQKNIFSNYQFYFDIDVPKVLSFPNKKDLCTGHWQWKLFTGHLLGWNISWLADDRTHSSNDFFFVPKYSDGTIGKECRILPIVHFFTG